MCYWLRDEIHCRPHFQLIKCSRDTKYFAEEEIWDIFLLFLTRADACHGKGGLFMVLLFLKVTVVLTDRHCSLMDNCLLYYFSHQLLFRRHFEKPIGSSKSRSSTARRPSKASTTATKKIQTKMYHQKIRQKSSVWLVKQQE